MSGVVRPDQIADPNNPTESGYLDQAHAAIQAGADPIKVANRLSDLVHQYRASLGQKKDQPDALTPAETAAGALATVNRGVTLGAGNRIAAGIEAALPQALGGTKGFDYPAALADQNAAEQGFAAENPVTHAVLGAAASVPATMTGAGLLGKAAQGAGALGNVARIARFGEPATGFLPTVSQMARQGATIGVVSGALQSPDYGNVGQVAKNAAGGALAGGIASPVIGYSLTKLAQGGASVIAKVLGDKQAARLQDVMGLAPTQPGRVADTMTKGALASGGFSPEDLANSLVADSPQTAMDVGARPVQALARQAQNVPQSTAGQQIGGFLSNRAVNAGSRVGNMLSSTTRIAPQDFDATVEQMIANRKAMAEPLYDAAMASEPIPLDATPKEGGASLGDILQRPSVKKAMAYGEQIAAERGQAVPDLAPPAAARPGTPPGFSDEQWAQLVKENPQLAQGTPQNGVPIQNLHDIKLKLDDMLGYARNNGTLPDGSPATKAMLQAIQGTRGDLLDVMDSHAPLYGVARRAYAGDAAMQDAYEQGRAFFSSPSNTAAQGQTALGDLTPAEQDLWRQGGMTWLKDKLATLASNLDLPEASRNVNVVQRLFGNARDAERARLLFPDEASYQQFLAQVKPETQFPITSRFLQNQSSTAAQQAERGMTPTAWDAANAVNAMRGSPYALARLAARFTGRAGQQALPVPVANAVGQNVTATGPALQALIQRMQALPNPAAASAAIRNLIGRTAAVGATQRTP